MPRVAAVIPARYRSTRFPGKALAPVGQQSMIEVVWQRVCQSQRLDRVIIATEDSRIADAATGFGADVAMTATTHASGTDRVAEVVDGLDDDFDLIVNVQGDEPLITPTCLDRLVESLREREATEMATLAEPIDNVEQLFDPNVVKVVTANDGHALYFSRSPIPYHRGDAARLDSDFSDALQRRRSGLQGYRKHQGIYGYRRSTLLALTRRQPSDLEIDEGLEQLRALQAGIRIHVVDSDFRSMSVDTPADLDQVNRILTRECS